MAAVGTIAQFDELVRQINARNLAPIYLLHGEEGYFIDELLRRFEALIPEQDRDFNLYTLYAPEVSADTIMDTCRRYPMMADYQVVIVKEAQAVTAAQLNRLHLYAKQPSATTVLVIACRGEKCKAKELIKEMANCRGEIFESTPLKDTAVGPAISKYIKDKGLSIDSKGLVMLRDFVGSDLSRIYNEIDKLTVALPSGAAVTPEAIEKHIGVSKDYNNFELIGALANKDSKKAFTIVNHFKRDTKKNPFVVTIGTIWTYFSNLLVLLYAKDKSDAGLCAAIGRKGSWLPPDYKAGMRNYNAWMLIEILRAIREADCRSKGVDSRMDPYDLLYDLIFHILTAQGNIN